MSSMMQTCQKNLSFSLCTIPSVYPRVATSDEWIKSEIEVSANLVYINVEHQ